MHAAVRQHADAGSASLAVPGSFAVNGLSDAGISCMPVSYLLVHVRNMPMASSPVFTDILNDLPYPRR